MKKLPKFKTEKEEAIFWSTHSPLDYPDEFYDIEELFKFSEKLCKKILKKKKH